MSTPKINLPSIIATTIASYLPPQCLPNFPGIYSYDASPYQLPPSQFSFLINPSIINVSYNTSHNTSSPIIPNHIHIHKLQHLHIKYTTPFITMMNHIAMIPSITLTQIDFYHMHIPQLPKLISANFTNCTFPELLINNTSQLQNLTICSPYVTLNCIRLTKQMNNLTKLKIINTTITNLSSSFPNLQQLHLINSKWSNSQFITPTLRKLNLINTDIDIAPEQLILLTKPNTIRSITIKNSYLSTLPPITKCTHIIINNCPNIDFAFLTGYPNLMHIKIKNCTINNFNHFGNCTKIKRIQLTNCIIHDRHTCFRATHPIILTVNNDAKSIAKSSIICDYHNTNQSYEIHIINIPALKPLLNSKLYTTFGISNSSILDLNHFTTTTWTKLTLIHISMCKQLQNIHGLTQCPNLKSLVIINCPKLLDLSPLQECHDLTTLLLKHVHNILDLSPLKSCRNKIALGIYNWYTLKNLSSFISQTNIISLDIHQCPTLTSINDLITWRDLEHVNIHDCINIKKIPVLKRLKELKISYCPKIKNIDNIFLCRNLIRININNCANITENEIHKLMEFVNAKYIISHEP